jgi:hypothetical protein
MSRDTQLKSDGKSSLQYLIVSQGRIDLDAIIYLMGVQELGQIHRNLRRKTKSNAHRYLRVYGFMNSTF